MSKIADSSMKKQLIITVIEMTGSQGWTGIGFSAQSNQGHGGSGRTPLEAVAEVFRHSGDLSIDEIKWERKIKNPLWQE